jgi:translocation and assembly module TamB
MRRHAANALLGVAVAVGVVALLLLGAVFFLTQTDPGREQVRRFAERQLNRAADGEVRIGRLEGNLLRRVRVVEFSIVDAQRRPFVQADTLETRFSLRSLLRRRIVLTDLRLAGADVVLDKPPGEEWNWTRIFPRDPPVVEEVRPGFGDWVRLENLELVDSRVEVRTAWSPPEDLNAEERQRTVDRVLAGETRENVQEVPGGYQNVMRIRELNALLPLVVPAHPDSMAIPIEVARLSAIVEPYLPPHAEVHDLSGSFRIGTDSLFFRNMQAVLPGSRVAGEGVYALDSGDLLLRLRGAPLAFDDLRWLYPPLPEEGGGTLLLEVHRRALSTRIVGREMDLRTGDARLEGDLELVVGDTFKIREADVRFAQVHTALLERVIPAFDAPRDGTLTGELTLAGDPSMMQLEGDVTFDDDVAGRSRVTAVGALGVEPDLRFRDLRMRFLPLQAELLRAAVPQLPVRGTIEGYANLTGTAGEELALDADLSLRDPRHGLSRVRATGGVDMRDELRLRNLLVRLDPLRLDLLRDEIPELPAGGLLAGQMRLDGVPTRALQVNGALTLTDPVTGVSSVAANGGLVFEDRLAFRDLRLRFDPLRLDLARPWLPDLDLPAGATVRGPLRLDGFPDGLLRVDGDLALADPATGVSRVVAAGGIVFEDRLAFRDLRLRFDPLRLDLARRWLPDLDLPAGATVTGPLRLDGFPAGLLRVDGDLALDDPATGVSRVAATGGIEFGDELRLHALHVRTDPLRLDLLRRWAPELPRGATVLADARLDGVPARMLQVDGAATIRDPATGESRVVAAGGIRTAGGLRFADLRLRFEPLRMNLVRTWAPDLPPDGTLAGRLRLDGDPTGMLRVDGDLTHEDPRLGTSHVVAAGGVDFTAGPRFADLSLRLQPLRMELVRALVPDFPLGGTLTGRATLNGAPDSRLEIAGDVEHREGGEYSRVAGAVTWVPGARGWASVDVDLMPLSLNVAGRFAPEAGLRGTVSGALQARGNLDRLGFETDLRVHDGGGAVAARGTLDLAGAQPAYDVTATFRDFDAAAITTRAPASTSLTGPLAAAGRGTDPATMRLQLTADLVDSRVADLAADRVRLRVAVADGLLRADSSTIRIGETFAVVDGSFGLRADRHGVLSYRLTTDAPGVFVPLATGEAPPTATARRLAGRPRPGDPPPDAAEGRLEAEGTLAGNVARFDASGRAVAEDLVVRGNAVGYGWAVYSVQGIGTDQAVVEARTWMRDVRAQGLAFDSLAATVEYAGGRFGTGRLVLDAHADDDASISADARFALSLDRSEVQLADLVLGIDTVTWRTTRPTVVAWGGPGVEVQALEMTSDAGGLIRVDGRLPVDGTADLQIALRQVEIGHVTALLQREEETRGRLDLDARLQGTRASPVITGSALLVDASHDGHDLPDTRATFTYVDRELIAETELLRGGAVLAVAEARLPIDLTLGPVEGPRLLEGGLAIDVRADSLPVGVIAGFTDQIEDLTGRVTGDFSVRGTWSAPDLQGRVDVDLPTLRVVPLGVTFESIVGSLALEGDGLRVDSLHAWSRGPIRVAGEVGLATLTQPSFDLTVEADDALVVDTDQGRMRLDARLAITGPFDDIHVSGEVETRSGVIYIPELSDFGGGRLVNLDDPAIFARADTLLRAERDALRRRNPFLERLSVDVSVVVDRDVWLRSTEANVEIYTLPEIGPMRVLMNGRDNQLSLAGTINTDRGEYEFMSRRFVLTRGAAIFDGGPELNPFLQVAAEHEVRLPAREALSIRVVLDGDLENLAINIESSAQPPIPQTDLLSYLAFGRDASSLLMQQGSTLSGEGGIGGGVVGNVAGLATQQMASMAMEAVVEDLERDALRALRLDVFRITPADLPAEVFTGNYLDVLRGTEVEAGRYVQPRLFVAGQLRAASPVPGVLVEYRTPQGFQWRTTWAPRFLPPEPTLEELEPVRRRVFGSFLFREWRF